MRALVLAILAAGVASTLAAAEPLLYGVSPSTSPERWAFCTSISISL